MERFKKFLPFVLFGFGLFVLIVVFFVVKGGKKDVETVDETKLLEVNFDSRPVVSLTPTSDGHWLNLKIDKIVLPKTASVDYELLYSLPDGRTQGVPGNVSLNSDTKIERKLLLGSESSGKYRYDEGVKDGSLTIRLRDERGKLLAKFSTKFHLQSSDLEITSVDENFKYVLDKKPKGVFFVTMETFGLMDTSVQSVASGPYGVFTSDANLASGVAEGWKVVDLNIFYK